jgi:hypothetical protein
VKGAIHVSFLHKEDFDAVWPFAGTSEERKAQAIEQVDARIQAATNDDDRQKLEATRDTDIEKAVDITGDPVRDNDIYEYEARMLDDWCRSPQVTATLKLSMRALGELLRGFNENIYQSIAKSEQQG